MGTVFGILWIIGFGLVATFCLMRRRETSHYKTFQATVTAVQKSPGNHTAVLQPETPQIQPFEIEFQDLGDYRRNETVQCMWDGQDETTVQEDLRENLKWGIIFSSGAVALMSFILVINLIILN